MKTTLFSSHFILHPSAFILPSAGILFVAAEPEGYDLWAPGGGRGGAGGETFPVVLVKLEGL